MVKIHTIYKNDTEHRPQRDDHGPWNITELQGQSRAADQRFIYLRIGRIGNNGNDENR